MSTKPLIDQMYTMYYTALNADRTPKRWVISRLVDRRLRREQHVSYTTPIHSVLGLAVVIDKETPVGWGLVVE